MNVTGNHAAYAQSLARLHPSQNPLINPQVLSAMQQSAPAVIPHLQAIAMDPNLAHVATNGNGVATMQSAKPGSSSSSGSGMGSDLNPKNQRTRAKSVRHQICGFGQVNLASGVTAGVSAIPYQWFKATRAVIAPMTISGGGDLSSSVSNWQVGTLPQFASLDGEPLSSFAASSNATFIDFDDCQPSLSISAQVKALASITFWAALVGESRGQAIQDRPLKTKVSRLPIKSTAIAAGSTITITSTPTVDFWGRKIVLADAGTNQYGDTFNVTAGANGASGLLLSEIYVANNPQFLTAPTANVTSYVPCSLFLGLYDLWLDLDRASVAVPYTFQVYNPGTVTLTFAGVVEGDIAA